VFFLKEELRGPGPLPQLNQQPVAILMNFKSGEVFTVILPHEQIGSSCCRFCVRSARQPNSSDHPQVAIQYPTLVRW